MKHAAILFCVFISCWGPMQSAGEATRFIGAQTDWVQLHSTIVQDGAGYDAIMTLKGKQSGQLCGALVTNLPDLAPNLCVGSNGNVRNADGTVTHAQGTD